MIATKNDKLELQDCLEFNRTAKVRCALCLAHWEMHLVISNRDLTLVSNLFLPLPPRDSLVLGFFPHIIVLSCLQVQCRRGS